MLLCWTIGVSVLMTPLSLLHQHLLNSTHQPLWNSTHQPLLMIRKHPHRLALLFPKRRLSQRRSQLKSTHQPLSTENLAIECARGNMAFARGSSPGVPALLKGSPLATQISARQNKSVLIHLAVSGRYTLAKRPRIIFKL